MIYITADLHFNHNKPFIYKERGFNSVEEMNNQILDNWNKTITDNDEVYILGDLMLGDNDSGIKLINQLNGNKHIILGNHDTNARIVKYLTILNCASIGFAERLKYNKHSFYLTHYPTITANYDDYKTGGVINLCGHTHTNNAFSDFDKGLIYHCELDAHNCYPISIDKILADINNKLTL